MNRIGIWIVGIAIGNLIIADGLSQSTRSISDPVVAVDTEFRVLPYVQNPTSEAVTIRWLANSSAAGKLVVEGPDYRHDFESQGLESKPLAYNPFAEELRDRPHTIPWIHSVRVEGLRAGQEYQYRVMQAGQQARGLFRTSPARDEAIRFMVFADSETEPESSSTPPVEWPVGVDANRPKERTQYVVNQTIGFRENLRIIEERKPNFVSVVGDLVEAGGEQRDWDEFWRHLAGDYGRLATHVPLFTAIGNHENYGGPGALGGYSAAASNFGVEKYRTYFETPTNHADNPNQIGRYYRVDFGPITLITLDSSDGNPHQSPHDTNFNLQGSHAPDFNPGSEQYRWLEKNLREAQERSHFVFVQFHHVPYGSGPHSIPMTREGFSGQSGIPLRLLFPLFFRFGVDAVFCGHDEMLERSWLEGEEERRDGTKRRYGIHVFDTGIGGDGLRGPATNFDNPFRKFLAHDNAKEIWSGQRLVSGGKHYGHLEVNVFPDDEGKWRTKIEPVCAFPLMNDAGEVVGWERRIYDDVVEFSQDQ